MKQTEPFHINVDMTIDQSQEVARELLEGFTRQNPLMNS